MGGGDEEMKVVQMIEAPFLWLWELFVGSAVRFGPRQDRHV